MHTYQLCSHDMQVDDIFASNMRLQSVALHTGQPLVAALLGASLLEEVMPVHDAAVHETIMPKFWSPFPNSSKIRSYYGDSVALYFEWMQFMWTWLAIPGVASVAIYITHLVTGPHPARLHPAIHHISYPRHSEH